MAKLEPPNLTRYWRNRRWMAWSSLTGLALLALGCLIAPDAAGQAQGVLGTIALAFATTIGAYIGFATLDDMSARK